MMSSKNDLVIRVSSSPIDSTLMFSEVKYTDVSVSGGYAYNWVFARNWVLAGSVSLALAYKRSSGDVTHRASLSVTLSLIISISMASDALVWYGTIADGMQG